MKDSDFGNAHSNVRHRCQISARFDVYYADIDHAEDWIAPQPALNDSRTGKVRTNLPSPHELATL